VANGGEAGAVRTWLRLPEGLSATGALEWTETLAAGQTVRHRTAVSVASAKPQAVVAKAASTDPAQASRPAGEG